MLPTDVAQLELERNIALEFERRELVLGESWTSKCVSYVDPLTCLDWLPPYSFLLNQKIAIEHAKTCSIPQEFVLYSRYKANSNSSSHNQCTHKSTAHNTFLHTSRTHLTRRIWSMEGLLVSTRA